MISQSRRRIAKDKLGRHNLTGEGMFSPAESVDVHWFGKARAGLELLGKQKTTPPRVLVGSRGSGIVASVCGGIPCQWEQEVCRQHRVCRVNDRSVLTPWSQAGCMRAIGVFDFCDWRAVERVCQATAAGCQRFTPWACHWGRLS